MKKDSLTKNSLTKESYKVWENKNDFVSDKPSSDKSSSEILSSSKAPAPVGPYPHARRVGDLLFLSGMGPRKPGTREIPGVEFDEAGCVKSHDIRKQTQSVIENISCVLEEFGCSLQNIVDVQVFLTNIPRDFKEFNEVYAKHFSQVGATRTTVEVSSLPTPIAVELKVIASCSNR